MESIWEQYKNFKERPALKENIKADVAIIGGGMAGLLTAYMLKKKGRKPVVIEAERICSGNTGRTTAKITSQHSLFYNNLYREFGEDKAKHYLEANELAIEEYRKIIRDNKIECDFRDIDTYLYSTSSRGKIEEEYETLRRLGFEADIVDEIELPIRVEGALRFPNQGQFNPIKFLNKISDDIDIYENTRVTNIEENVVTTEGGTVVADVVVMATHYPIVNAPGYYFLRMHQEKSYVIALENAQKLNGAYIGIGGFDYSFREYEGMLLLGGAGHRTGKCHTNCGYDKLRQVAANLYPDAIEKYHWSAEDCVAFDNIPYIGQFSKKTPDMYIATGFKKWGMTSSMVAAMIISDNIIGKSNEYEDIFSPARFDMTASLKHMVEDGKYVVTGLVGKKLHVPSERLETVKRGEGSIIEFNEEKVGVYKDMNGEIYFVNVNCSHLGCQLEWNKEDLSWDCPCHGSRFDYMGNVIDSPASRGIGYE